MRKCGVYFCAQLKRIGRAFPTVLTTTVLLAGIMALLTSVLLKQDASSDKKQKVQIGLAGDIEGSYLGIGIHTIQNLDSSRFAITFEDMTQEEAQKLLAEGKISAYVIVPEGFVDSVSSGENKPVTYVTSLGATGIGSMIMDEIIDTVSKLIVESQNAIYGMQSFLIAHDMQDIYWESTEKLYFQFIDFILGRSRIFDKELLGVSDSLSFAGYYLCGILVLFLLMWGIVCSPLFVKRDNALLKLLAARGQSATGQIVGEYAAYLVLMIGTLFFVVLLLMAGMLFTDFRLPEWLDAGLGMPIRFFLKMLPVVGMISAMQFLIYELISGMVSGILTQFLLALSLGYLSGCFYPISFFPESIQKLSHFLPTGAAMEYAGGYLTGEQRIGALLTVGLYFVCFLVLATAVRHCKIQNG